MGVIHGILPREQEGIVEIQTFDCVATIGQHHAQGRRIVQNPWFQRLHV